MRRWILKAGTTDLEGLVLEDAPVPEPGPGEVRIRIHAVSLNYPDQLVLKVLRQLHDSSLILPKLTYLLCYSSSTRHVIHI